MMGAGVEKKGDGGNEDREDDEGECFNSSPASPIQNSKLKIQNFSFSLLSRTVEDSQHLIENLFAGAGAENGANGFYKVLVRRSIRLNRFTSRVKTFVLGVQLVGGTSFDIGSVTITRNGATAKRHLEPGYALFLYFHKEVKVGFSPLVPDSLFVGSLPPF